MTQAKNVAASVRERLRQRAAAANRPFDEVLTYHAMERFLYRLSQTKHRERFVLKGALMLQLWGATIQRPTRDIDFLGRGDVAAEQLAAIVADCIAVEVLPDGLVFDASSIDRHERDPRAGTVRRCSCRVRLHVGACPGQDAG